MLDLAKHNKAERLGAEFDQAMKAWRASPNEDTTKALASAWVRYDNAASDAVSDLEIQSDDEAI